ncbi:MAG: efflux RND transporter periplasmic adaptor subunit [Candidatus Latescibacterota bacterium]|nr:efflux RND transporter periplasmic adaptor subunit [Candidatus Latescibacterota bacterium]
MKRFLITFLAFFLVGCGGESEQAGKGGERGGRNRAVAAIPVKAEAVVRSEISRSVLKNTTLEADRWVNVRARRQGQIVKIHKEEGDAVREGNVIAELDSDDAKLQVTQMDVAYMDAKRNFTRVEKIFKRNLVSEEQFETAKTQMDRAGAQLEQAKLNLSYTKILTPIEGIVTARIVEIGNVVTNNQVVFSVANFDPLLARIRVPEKEIGRIEVGQEARISVESENEKLFKGRVKMISPVVDPESGTIKVTVEIPGSNRILRPGMFASVHIITETRINARVIPKKALVLEGEGNQVFVLDRGEEGSKARRSRIEIGFSDSDRLEVVSGLDEGDLVITVGQDGLRPGANVRIVGEGLRPNPGGQDPAGSERQSRATQGQVAIASANDSEGGANGTRSGGRQVGQRGSGGRGDGNIKAMQARMFERFPEMKKIYTERVKKEPDLAIDINKFRAFIGEMREKGIITSGGR